MSLQTIATSDGTAQQRGASTDALDSTYIQQAISDARSLIGEVPGAGPVRGVWMYKGDKYAFRDNASQSSGAMYKATSSGWVLQAFGCTLDFDTGSTEISEGDTITGDTSGATATVERIIVQSGGWSGNDALGYMVLSGIAGIFQNGETVNTSAASLTSTAEQISIPAGGSYDFINENFYGASNLERMYGCNGVGNAFEWDGSIFAPIRTGMVTDTPNKIGEFNNHLFLSFPGGSVQHSGIGDPLSWAVVLGAGELALGSDVVDFVPNFSTAFIIITKKKVFRLIGSDASSWDLKSLSERSGGIENTAQLLNVPVYMDKEGLREINATETTGGFSMGTLSTLVRKVLKGLKKKSISPVSSVSIPSKDQYRLFYDDGTFMIMDMSKGAPEIMFGAYDDIVNSSCLGEDSSGNEILLIGSTNGYVYEIDAGTSFDGSSYVSYFRLTYNNLGAPTRKKRFFKATLELDAAPTTTLYVLADFSYGNPDVPQTEEQQFNISGGGDLWDVGNWDEFYWSSQVEGLAEARIPGSGTNVSLTVYSDSSTEKPHTISGVTYHFSWRRLQK